MDRPFFHTTIDELERLVTENLSSRTVLGRVWEELTYRETERAKRLLRDVEGLLAGEVPRPPPPPRPDSPDSQIPLI
jgi:hypothetical protein